jgi:hypothetical protein
MKVGRSYTPSLQTLQKNHPVHKPYSSPFENNHTSHPLSRLLHRSLARLIRLGSAEATLEDLHAQQRRRRSPQHESDGGEACVGARSGAHGTAAEEQLAEEDGEGNEAGEVEEGADGLNGEVRVRVGSWGCVRGVLCEREGEAGMQGDIPRFAQRGVISR